MANKLIHREYCESCAKEIKDAQIRIYQNGTEHGGKCEMCKKRTIIREYIIGKGAEDGGIL